MNDKKKRGIVVPVMALAVCAVAMVGLGFALETSVTSDSNVVQKLMIDLDDNSGTLDSQDAPDGEGVNGLFDISIITTKKSTGTGASQQTEVKKFISNPDTYMKIFGNIATVELTVIVTGMDSATSSNGIKKISLGIYDGSSLIETMKFESGTSTTSTTETAKTTIKSTEDYSCNKVYTLKVLSINDVDVSPTGEGGVVVANPSTAYSPVIKDPVNNLGF